MLSWRSLQCLSSPTLHRVVSRWIASRLWCHLFFRTWEGSFNIHLQSYERQNGVRTPPSLWLLLFILFSISQNTNFFVVLADKWHGISTRDISGIDELVTSVVDCLFGLVWFSFKIFSSYWSSFISSLDNVSCHWICRLNSNLLNINLIIIAMKSTNPIHSNIMTNKEMESFTFSGISKRSGGICCFWYGKPVKLTGQDFEADDSMRSIRT